MALSQAKLQFWADHRYNVCISGRHGVGKTAQVFDLFNERYGQLGVDWLYFSASTMDPWVDFIGVPKERIAEDGTCYLDLVRPEMFARDRVKAIFLDEFNRSPKKIRNAVMELIQFKSINGHKFHTLEVVWTAINPPSEDDDEGMTYDVDEIDPAQLDRFHVFVDVPYSASKSFFKKKYGAQDGTAAVEWWTSLPTKIKDLISPRRLDYAIDCYQKGGDLKDILPKQANTTQLLLTLSEGSIKETLAKLKKDGDKARKKLAEDNFYNLAIEVILKRKSDMKYFLPKCPQEKIATLISESGKLRLIKILDAVNDSKEMFDVISEIVEAGTLTKAKTKTLQNWRIENFANQLGEEIIVMDLSKTVGDALAVGLSENTYDRLKTITRVTDELNRIPRGIDIPESVAKQFYEYMLIALSRSQQPTFGRFKKQWLHAMKKMHKIHPYETTMHKSKISISRRQLAEEHFRRYQNGNELNDNAFT